MSSATLPPDILPLAGKVVIELGHSVAAPFAGQILGDLGAEVIKIEKPDGDDARKWGPPFVDGSAATFQSLNRNKRSLRLDLRQNKDHLFLKNLILDRADVVLQNMRPGQVESLGLDAATLHLEKPQLVYCNLGAFGSMGPMSQRPGYDPLMQAFGGIMSVVGEPGGNPVRVGPSIIDMGTGMWAALGIVCQLMQRQTTGIGGVVDVSLFETAAAWMTMYSAQFLSSGKVPGKNGSGQTGIVPYRAFKTADGDLVVSAGNDTLFKRLCEVLNRPEWIADEKFANNPARVLHAHILNAMLEDCFVRKSSSEWSTLLDNAGVPCAPVQDVAAMLAHPQTEAMGLLQKVPGSSIPMIGLPMRLDGARPQPRSSSPTLGEMNLTSPAMTTDATP
jgi:crotonobetainyl-CoA:carnitine CoA-transferase CaiB-like acyl-CoA transferase